MKLWQKIFLSTLALTVAVTSLLSLLFLLSSRSSLWERENQRALTQQQSLASLIKTGVVSQRLQSGKVRLSAEEADDAAASVLARQEADEYLVTSRLLRRAPRTGTPWPARPPTPCWTPPPCRATTTPTRPSPTPAPSGRTGGCILR